jgi:hypothetical protein
LFADETRLIGLEIPLVSRAFRETLVNDPDQGAFCQWRHIQLVAEG